MKQIVQSARTGKLALVEVPAPSLVRGQVLVRNHYSVVSPGTEKMAVEFARKSLLAKARKRPDLVKQVVRKLQQEGPLPTYRAVTTRLDAPQPLGYSCAGIVEAVGEEVARFAPGDRVACAGAGYANHAEWVSVPENLVARLPEDLPLEKASFATLGAIALQGLRVAQPALGELAVVIGLGLIGQLTVQLLRANGCRVLGIDLDLARVKQSLDQGASWGAAPEDDHAGWIADVAGGHGADFAIVSAASDHSSPLQLAAELCRLKGRVVAVGATAMHLDRRTFYEKELELRMSTSSGPGRYDRSYEESGLDYPIAYVRWTENRNLAAFLELAASATIDPLRLEHRVVPFAEAECVYDELATGECRSLAVVFRYEGTSPSDRSLALSRPRRAQAEDEVGVGFVGAGNYAKNVLLPAVGRCQRVRRCFLVTATGPSARRSAERFGYARCGSDPAELFADPAIHLVFIATQHDSHALLAEAALRAGKAVWLEKPAALDADQLASLTAALCETDGFLTIGYNRRFSPHARALREAFARREGSLAIRYAVAAGPTPGGSWHTDPRVGGGRIVGESGHFVDLCAYLVGAPPVTVFARALGRDLEADDSTVALLGFADGSTAILEYLARASAQLPKERLEISGHGITAVCDNFRHTRILGGRTVRTGNQDKGQAAAVAEVIEAVRAGRPSPFTLEEIFAVSQATFAIRESARTGRPVALGGSGRADTLA